MESIPIAANRALAALSIVFEWDSKRTTPAYTGFNPCLRIAKYQERKDKRHIDTIEKVLEVTKLKRAMEQSTLLYFLQTPNGIWRKIEKHAIAME